MAARGFRATPVPLGGHERPPMADRGPLRQPGGTSKLRDWFAAYRPSPPRRSGVPSTRRMRVVLPGTPLKRRAGGGSARRVVRMDADQFGVSPWRGQDARVEATQERLPDGLSTNPGALPRTFRAGMPGKRASGAAFSLLRASCPPPFGPASPLAPLLRRSGYFLLVTQEKVTRPPKEDESSCSRQLTQTRRKIKSGPLPNPPL